MTRNEYEKAIISALSEASQTADPISIIRVALNNCDADFPYGDCRGILATLSKNDFTRWSSCSYEEARNFANEGVPTVCVSKERIILIAPDNSNEIEHEFVCKATSITPDEHGNLNFFAYSEPFERAINMGTVTDVPASITEDGFGGWYNPATQNKGVTRRVPRFVQKKSGPCLAYAIMSGNYYMKNLSTDPNTFFDDRYKNGYYNDSLGAIWESFTTIKNYSWLGMQQQLNSGNPVVVSGRSATTDHFVLVVGYTGCGCTESDYIVIDPWFSTAFPTTLAVFRKNYPNDTNQFKNETYNYSYPMFIFK